MQWFEAKLNAHSDSIMQAIAALTNVTINTLGNGISLLDRVPLSSLEEFMATLSGDSVTPINSNSNHDLIVNMVGYADIDLTIVEFEDVAGFPSTLEHRYLYPDYFTRGYNLLLPISPNVIISPQHLTFFPLNSNAIPLPVIENAFSQVDFNMFSIMQPGLTVTDVNFNTMLDYADYVQIAIETRSIRLELNQIFIGLVDSLNIFRDITLNNFDYATHGMPSDMPLIFRHAADETLVAYNGISNYEFANINTMRAFVTEVWRARAVPSALNAPWCHDTLVQIIRNLLLKTDVAINLIKTLIKYEKFLFLYDSSECFELGCPWNSVMDDLTFPYYMEMINNFRFNILPFDSDNRRFWGQDLHNWIFRFKK